MQIIVYHSKARKTMCGMGTFCLIGMISLQLTIQNGEMAFQELINSFNLNNATERKLYRAGNSATIKTLQNLPPAVSSGEVIIIWLPSLPDNSYGCQLLIHTSGAVQDVYLRHKYGSTWAGWGSFALS
ncbi:pyocin knob domain-containing protein [[Clostridium] symbiosum]|uniref:pyocin knob domain-containing protein n=2 Tax=Clostridium symbiosum TaxID=1512 RepID=UPI0034A57EE3